MKKYLIGMVAVVLAISAAAFTAPHKTVVTGVYYFPTDAAGNPQSYQKVGNAPYTSPQLGCSATHIPCEIAYDDYTATDQGGGNYQIAVKSGAQVVANTESFRP